MEMHFEKIGLQGKKQSWAKALICLVMIAVFWGFYRYSCWSLDVRFPNGVHVDGLYGIVLSGMKGYAVFGLIGSPILLVYHVIEGILGTKNAGSAAQVAVEANEEVKE